MTLFLTQLQLCAPLFILVLAGWILRKARFFGDETASALNAFTFRFLMPAMLFHLLSDLSEMPPVDPWVLGAYFGSCIIVFFLGHGFYGRIFKAGAAGSTILAMCGIFSNNVMLGIPILQIGFGPEGMPAASLIITFNALILWTLAIASVEFCGPRGSGGARFLDRIGELIPPLLRVLKNPVVLGILSGTLFGLTGLKLPAFAVKTLDLVSAATTPICLIAVGMGLARYSILGSAAKNACVTAVKLLIQPAAVYVLCRLLGIPTLETEVTTLMAALPVGINVYMMAADFKAEEGATSSSILLSTMLSAVTVPLLLAFFGVQP